LMPIPITVTKPAPRPTRTGCTTIITTAPTLVSEAQRPQIAFTTSRGTTPSGSARPPDVPFPVLIRDFEQLGRQVAALKTLIAGFESNAYYSFVLRFYVFVMPAGKAAFRNIAEYLRDTLRMPHRQAKARVKLAAELAPAPILVGGH